MCLLCAFDMPEPDSSLYVHLGSTKKYHLLFYFHLGSHVAVGILGGVRHIAAQHHLRWQFSRFSKRHFCANTHSWRLSLNYIESLGNCFFHLFEITFSEDGRWILWRKRQLLANEIRWKNTNCLKQKRWSFSIHSQRRWNEDTENEQI